MIDRYNPGGKLNIGLSRVINFDFHDDILPREQEILNTYEFLEDELYFIIRKKPTVLMFKEDYESHK